jgi:iron complex outermembrane receptor protein
MLAATNAVAAIPVNCVSRDIDGNGTIDKIQPNVGGNQLPTTSKFTASVGVEFRQPVFGDSNLVARLDASHRSKQYGDFVNANWVPGRTIANLRLGIERESYDVFLWCENLTDVDTYEQVVSAGTNLFGALATTATGINPVQRRIGFTGRYRF